MNARHSSTVKTSAGPAGFLLSRRATVSAPRSAHSTHWPLPPERLDFFHLTLPRSGAFMSPTSSLRGHISLGLDHPRRAGRIQGRSLQMLKSERIPADLRLAFEEEFAGHALDVDQGRIGG